MTEGQTVPETGDDTTARQTWMGLLARAPAAALAAAMDDVTLPDYRLLRAPQTGLVMARGRAGGTGDAFNLGEVSATRCSVEIAGGVQGHAYVLGRDRDHALRAALCDAMLQTDRAASIRDRVLAPLAQAEQARRQAQARRAAATRVEFFTLVRGA